MIEEKTICHKVSRCVDEVEKAIKTSSFNAGYVGHLLHEIRQDAQRMEDGLKARKAMMVSAGIEDEYQRNKGEKPDPKNKLITGFKETKGKLTYHFTVTERGKVVYDQDVHAGVICAVEKMSTLDKDGSMTGQTQKFTFGHPLAIWLAFDQLRQAIEARKIEIATALRNHVESGTFGRQARRKILRGINSML